MAPAVATGGTPVVAHAGTENAALCITRRPYLRIFLLRPLAVADKVHEQHGDGQVDDKVRADQDERDCRQEGKRNAA